MTLPPTHGQPMSAQAKDEFYDCLYKVRAACGPTANKNDEVSALIAVCIDQGFVAERQIVGLLAGFDCNPRHVAMILKKSAGPDPKRSLWRQMGKGIYCLN